MRNFKASAINETNYIIHNEDGFQVMKVARDDTAKKWILMSLKGDIIATAKSRFMLFSMYDIRVVEFVWPKMFELNTAACAA